ncbi:MAG: YcxB family protein [Oscillospiraceae bacterium]|nr:YcxB family protein [Oscillospiraceae bacterium]MBR7074842.1 YcxB family protein [Oscillospiraceae bacterium]
METFEVEMRHDRASLTALSHMQYDLFCQRNRMARGFLSLTLIVIAILYGGGSWWSLLIIAYACYLTTSTYASSNRTARRIADQLEQAGQPLPASRYIFEKNKMRIVDLNSGEELDPVAYGDVFGLGEDRDALYLFRSQYGGYRIPKEALGEREEAFRRFIQNKTGQLFIRRLTPLNRVRNWLHARETEPTHL